MAGNLNNLSVIITRPAHSADELSDMILAHAGRCTNLPLFAIETTLSAELLQKIALNLQQNCLVLCVSRNAAEQVLPNVAVTSNLQWAAIGPATAKYLQKYNIQNIIYPSTPPYDARSLVLELQLKSINLKNLCIMILTGEQGDGWLAEELQGSGAIVEVMPVYRRVMPQISCTQFKKIVSTLVAPAVFVITCVTSLVNLQILAAKSGINVYNMSLLVVSKRIHTYAMVQGFVNIYIAKSAIAADILSALLEIGEINVRTTTAGC